MSQNDEFWKLVVSDLFQEDFSCFHASIQVRFWFRYEWTQNVRKENRNEPTKDFGVWFQKIQMFRKSIKFRGSFSMNHEYYYKKGIWTQFGTEFTTHANLKFSGIGNWQWSCFKKSDIINFSFWLPTKITPTHSFRSLTYDSSHTFWMIWNSCSRNEPCFLTVYLEPLLLFLGIRFFFIVENKMRQTVYSVFLMTSLIIFVRSFLSFLSVIISFYIFSPPLFSSC